MLPHRYPFRFCGPGADGELRIAISCGDYWSRNEAALPGSLAIEILAQAAMRVLRPEATGPQRIGGLAGISSARFAAPLRPGDRLTAVVRLEGRFGAAVKARCCLIRDQTEVAIATLVLTDSL